MDFPVASKKCQKYITNSFLSDESAHVLKKAIPLQKLSFKLEDVRNVTHCDVILVYKTRENMLNHINLNKLIIRKKREGLNSLNIELNATAFSDLYKRLAKKGAIIYPPVLWLAEHYKYKEFDLNVSCFEILAFDKQEKVGFSSYNKDSGLRTYYDTEHEALDKLDKLLKF